ncbi:MAG TPA: histidinol-phosphatase HisJ family protein [Verrucomicrobiae bacterium]|nr:histidinol-phosphatase HisJ family protein [Verrucomicrobiae bacterium]
MGLPADYHMHTPLCRHATGDPTQYAARAAAIGLDEIGFSDHSPMIRDDFDDWRMRFDQVDEYVASVRKAQQAFPKLTIRLALEVDYLPGHENWIRKLATMHPWDYFIGSVHYVSESWAIDDPRRLSEWNQRDVWDVWSAYFERLSEAAQTGFFDIIGHADLPKKFGKRPDRDCTPLYEQFLDRAVKHGCAIELNTAGLRQECREIYPGEPLLKLAHQKGVPITFGSDAHAPQDVGMQFEVAVGQARKAGYTHWCRFVRRKREMVKL